MSHGFRHGRSQVSTQFISVPFHLNFLDPNRETRDEDYGLNDKSFNGALFAFDHGSIIVAGEPGADDVFCVREAAGLGLACEYAGGFKENVAKTRLEAARAEMEIQSECQTSRRIADHRSRGRKRGCPSRSSLENPPP